MLRHMRESTLRQTLPVSEATKTQKIQSSDRLRCCVLLHYVISHLLSDQTYFQVARQMGCRNIYDSNRMQYKILFND